MVENVRRLRKVAKKESHKEIHIKYSGDMDPSGDDMDRDLMERMLSVNAKINIDEFLETTFTSQKIGETGEEVTSEKTGEEILADYIKGDWRLETLYEDLEACPREGDKRDPKTGKLLIGRNTIHDIIRIRKSEIIAHYYPKHFPHLVPLTKEQEQKWQRRKYSHQKNWKIVHFERIAITGDQIRNYQLPEMPADQKTLDKLDRDTKAQRFKDKYGALMAVEVDALDATYPEVLEELVQKSIDDHYDPEIYKTEILEKYGTKKYKKELNDKVIQSLEDLLTELKKKTEEDFKNTEIDDV